MKQFKRARFTDVGQKQLEAIASESGTPIDVVKQSLADIFANEKVYMNDVYQVTMRKIKTPVGGMVWLSIKRLDKAPVHDWRDLQEIKNELVGPEHEGVELYPAESRRVDVANQYHLFVLETQGRKWPFGMTDRLVVDGTGQLTEANTRQRPL